MRNEAVKDAEAEPMVGERRGAGADDGEVRTRRVGQLGGDDEHERRGAGEHGVVRAVRITDDTGDHGRAGVVGMCRMRRLISPTCSSAGCACT